MWQLFCILHLCFMVIKWVMYLVTRNFDTIVLMKNDTYFDLSYMAGWRGAWVGWWGIEVILTNSLWGAGKSIFDATWIKTRVSDVYLIQNKQKIVTTFLYHFICKYICRNVASTCNKCTNIFKNNFISRGIVSQYKQDWLLLLGPSNV